MKDIEKQQKISTILFVIVTAIFFIAMFTGCTTVPVTSKFPDGPGQLVMSRCPDLQKLNDDSKLSDISKTITVNYTTYYECAIKVDSWIKWYTDQKVIFDSLK